MFCSKCGNRLPDDAMFCSVCGSATVKNSEKNGDINSGNIAANQMLPPNPKQLTYEQKESLDLANRKSAEKLKKSIEELKSRKTSYLLLYISLAIIAAIISLILFYSVSVNGLTSDDSVVTFPAALISGAVSLGMLLGSAIISAKFNDMIAKFQIELSLLDNTHPTEKELFNSLFGADSNKQ